MRYIKYWIWFIKESLSFMAPRNKLWIVLNSLPKAHGFARNMVRWDKATPEQRESWYLSGEGRTLEF